MYFGYPAWGCISHSWIRWPFLVLSAKILLVEFSRDVFNLLKWNSPSFFDVMTFFSGLFFVCHNATPSDVPYS
jgi:hypothetical protein